MASTTRSARVRFKQLALDFLVLLSHAVPAGYEQAAQTGGTDTITPSLPLRIRAGHAATSARALVSVKGGN